MVGRVEGEGHRGKGRGLREPWGSGGDGAWATLEGNRSGEGEGCGDRLETWVEVGENRQGPEEHGEEAVGKMGKTGAAGDRGVPGGDGEAEKAAQLLCPKAVPLWSSAGEEAA